MLHIILILTIITTDTTNKTPIDSIQQRKASLKEAAHRAAMETNKSLNKKIDENHDRNLIL